MEQLLQGDYEVRLFEFWLLTSSVHSVLLPSEAPPQQNNDVNIHMPFVPLPPELWKIIIGFATESYPAPLSIHNMVSSDSFSSPILTDHQSFLLYRQSLRYKLKCSCVSRSWRSISTQYLFETVWIKSQSQAKKLAQELHRDNAVGRDLAGCVGWWVRSIFIDANHLDGSTEIDIITKCPRLVRYRNMRQGVATSHSAALTKLFPHTSEPTTFNSVIIHREPVKLLDWTDCHRRCFNQFFQFETQLIASRLSRLECLILKSPPGMVTQDYGSQHPSFPLYLPSLKMLRVLGLEELAQTLSWEMPSLKMVSMTSLCCQDEDPVATHSKAFLDVHGCKIEELEISDNFPLYDLDMNVVCPNVHTLRLSPNKFARWSLPVFRKCRVKHLLLLDTEKWLSGRGLNSWSLALEQFPCLETVQDVSWESHQVRCRALHRRGTDEAAHYITFWEAWKLILVSRGVQLLGWDGKVITM